MRRGAKVFFWSCIAAIFFTAGIQFLTKLTDPRYAYAKNREFMEESDAYDVLFFGNSHMANAVYPLELWNDYGMTSYNLAGFGNQLPITYWNVINALERSDPCLVVVDCHSITSEEKVHQKEMLHVQIDHLPFSFQKVEMVNDLIEEPGERLEFIWPFSVYHDRWWDLDQADFEKSINRQKGAEIAFFVVPPAEMAERPSETIELDTTGVTYLRRIIEECKAKKKEILLTYLPFPASEEEWREALYAERIAQEYGISYLNFLDLSVVDLTVDCADESSHLNGSGGRKVTDYLGRYIKERYDIDDHRGEEAFLDWDEDYRQYTDYKIEVMGQMESLDKYLMMLADPVLDCCIYVKGDADIWRQNELYLPLIENVAEGKTVKLRQAASQGKDYFLVVDRQRGELYECVDGERLQIETSFGTVRYETDENGDSILCLQDGENDYLQETPQENGLAVQIVTINSADGRIVHGKRFDSSLSVFTE